MPDTGDGTDAETLMRSFLERRGELVAYLRALGGVDLAEDAFQETFLVVQRRLGDFRRDGDFHAWVRGIGRNVVRGLARRSGRLRAVGDEALADLIDLAAAEPARADVREEAGIERLRRCLARLGADQRRMLDLRYGQDRPLADIAGELGRTVGAVQVALSRLRAALAACVDRREPA
jgi:RNA polymerase sigma-70 factor (ECF subfamily)